MNASLSILPVFCFLTFLLLMDSFNLVSVKKVVFTIFLGIFVAGAAYFINIYLQQTISLHSSDYSDFIAPIIEEILKSLPLFYLLKRNKIGFSLDASIIGFSIGAGFSLVENIYYSFIITDSNVLIWIIRGFGTAIMHGGNTAIVFALFYFIKEYKKSWYISYLLGLVIPILIHSLFNQFLLNPIISTLLVLILIPSVLIAIFELNSIKIRKWIETEFDSDIALLKMINDGNFAESHIGRYIIGLKEKLSKEQVFDMIVFIRLYLELSVKAKANLMMKENGLDPIKDDAIEDKLKEFQFLRKSIGKTAFVLLSPIFKIKGKDIWKLNLLDS